MTDAPARAAEAEALEVLATGDLDVIGLLPHASNYTFLAEVSLGSRSVRVVYKPRDGEMPLWDFRVGTLCRREVAAYVLAKALGWPNVPQTVLRDGPMGAGSVQLFVGHDPREHYFTLRDRWTDAFREVAAFDVVVGNGDRKSGHCLAGDDGRIWAVDHGLCFNVEPVLRTVIWDFAGHAVPRALLDDVARIAGELDDGRMRMALLELLDPEEVDATSRRARALVEAGTFPVPGLGRSRPWPAI
ncbi:MAG TPA: SCO1664 family protein [Actinomycetota bacterium]|nr:SCO1664 family protein [Actinomycetota bacterium]